MSEKPMRFAVAGARAIFKQGEADDEDALAIQRAAEPLLAVVRAQMGDAGSGPGWCFMCKTQTDLEGGHGVGCHMSAALACMTEVERLRFNDQAQDHENMDAQTEAHVRITELEGALVIAKAAKDPGYWKVRAEKLEAERAAWQQRTASNLVTIGKLKAERDALRERLTCAEVICQQTQKIDDERQSFKTKLREAEAENKNLMRNWRNEQDSLSAEQIKTAELVAERDALRGQVNPDLTNAQYHRAMDLLWGCLPKNYAHGKDTVFEKIVCYVDQLQAEQEADNP